MKTSVLFLLVFSFLFFFDTKSQIDVQSPIEKLEVSYKQVDLVEVTIEENTKYLPQITFQLLSGSNVSKLYYKIIDESSNTVLVDVNYLLSSIPVLDQAGKKIFYKDEQDVYHIMPAIQIPLKAYLFQLITEDSQGNQSPILSENH